MRLLLVRDVAQFRANEFILIRRHCTAPDKISPAFMNADNGEFTKVTRFTLLRDNKELPSFCRVLRIYFNFVKTRVRELLSSTINPLPIDLYLFELHVVQWFIYVCIIDIFKWTVIVPLLYNWNGKCGNSMVHMYVRSIFFAVKITEVL